MLIIVQRMSNKRYEISRKYHMIATKRTGSINSEHCHCWAQLLRRTFAQDGSLVNFNQNIQTPNVQYLSFNPNTWLGNFYAQLLHARLTKIRAILQPMGTTTTTINIT